MSTTETAAQQKKAGNTVETGRKRRSALSIMGSLIGLVKPLIHIMLDR